MAEIEAACNDAGRAVSEVKLLSVTKAVGLSELEQAIALGHHAFGENREPQFKARQSAYPEQDWHFIGSIQTNKLKDIVGRAALIHSVASAHALQRIDRLALDQSIVQGILLEVNTSGELSKDGVPPEQLPALVEMAEESAGVDLRGLMTMAPRIPLDASPDERTKAEARARQAFSDLRELAIQYNLCELSMGMSGDFALAILEGATIVRIGTRLWI
jgi:pyridoxal phosphate enzyme (YggS family)